MSAYDARVNTEQRLSCLCIAQLHVFSTLVSRINYSGMFYHGKQHCCKITPILHDNKTLCKVLFNYQYYTEVFSKPSIAGPPLKSSFDHEGRLEKLLQLSYTLLIISSDTSDRRCFALQNTSKPKNGRQLRSQRLTFPKDFQF